MFLTEYIVRVDSCCAVVRLSGTVFIAIKGHEDMRSFYWCQEVACPAPIIFYFLKGHEAFNVFYSSLIQLTEHQSFLTHSGCWLGGLTSDGLYHLVKSWIYVTDMALWSNVLILNYCSLDPEKIKSVNKIYAISIFLGLLLERRGLPVCSRCNMQSDFKGRLGFSTPHTWV